MDISERDFEATIERALLAGGPDGVMGMPGETSLAPTAASGTLAPQSAQADFVAAGHSGANSFAGPAAGPLPRIHEPAIPYLTGAEPILGGYRKRASDDYDKALCLIPADVLGFIYATQPKEWEKFRKQHGDDAKDQLLRRLAHEIEERGALDVLRGGIKAHGCSFRLAYFRPASGLNDELRTLYQANVFSVVRQLRYSERNGNSLDLALFLNGLPLFTAELKNPLTGQTVNDAIRQYRTDRDPREPLFAFGRCLAHFAVDPDLVYMTTHLRGTGTEFLPFNQGHNGGAGNPPSWQGFATAYLWERIWSRDSVLDLVQRFIHIVEVENDKGKKTGTRKLLFPRYHQLDAVRRLVADACANGAGRRYLIQHSAGSGKSNSIAWLAHQLSVLHDANDRRVFDSIVVVTDRRVLDRQLQSTVRQFEQTLGIVENIDTTSQQLKQALENGKTIIVTTLQKFPRIADEAGAMPGKRFAVIVDEAHSSQSGESSRSLKLVLKGGGLEEAEEQDADDGEGTDLEDRIAETMRLRGPLPNVSFFAFTATPKQKTLELFGQRREDGKYEAFSRYSMRQAIEEHFILDVLEHYVTYKAYWNLLKKIETDPRYERHRAEYLLKSFVELHPHAIGKKVAIMVDHFVEQVAHQIGGKAKAMIVTRSRLHAVRYKQAVDAYLREQNLPYQALVAFSGTVSDGGRDYTEAGMNGFADTQTADTFNRDDYRLLIVANKFQTGFDQPLLHTMYVDKKLGGVNAVQTLSRLNRTYPGKDSTMVLDFANEADEIQKAFAPYYDRTLLEHGTDPNLLYDYQTRLRGFALYDDADVQKFAALAFDKNVKQDKLHAALAPVVERYLQADEEERVDFRGVLNDYVRLYAFLSQLLTFVDGDLEKLYVFAKLLLRKLPVSRDRLPVEIQQNIDIDSYRIQQTAKQKIALDVGADDLKPMGPVGGYAPVPEELEALSQIIAELNSRFGTEFSEDDKVCIRELEARLAGNPDLDASVRHNTPENARLTFEHIVQDLMQSMISGHFTFYKQVTDNPAFAKTLLDWLFERYLTRSAVPAPVDR